ncbi:MAG: hypothetical protein NZZ60_02385 [Bacteroidia bacterium]|nr:hypothetical protein [Bacteroidia bacterium]MCX7652234.1 hypothetical protein [Bacteroidia bacterium]
MKTMYRLITVAVASLLAIFTLTQCASDPCKNVNCNSGRCSDGECICSLPYEGRNCEIDARSKFLGTWRGRETCGPESHDITYTIQSSSDGKLRITDNILEITYSANLTSSNAFSIPSQVVDGITVSGQGSLNGTTLTLNHSYIDDEGNTGSCSASLTRQ